MQLWVRLVATLAVSAAQPNPGEECVMMQMQGAGKQHDRGQGVQPMRASDVGSQAPIAPKQAPSNNAAEDTERLEAEAAWRDHVNEWRAAGEMDPAKFSDPKTQSGPVDEEQELQQEFKQAVDMWRHAGEIGTPQKETTKSTKSI